MTFPPERKGPQLRPAEQRRTPLVTAVLIITLLPWEEVVAWGLAILQALAVVSAVCSPGCGGARCFMGVRSLNLRGHEDLEQSSVLA